MGKYSLEWTGKKRENCNLLQRAPDFFLRHTMWEIVMRDNVLFLHQLISTWNLFNINFTIIFGMKMNRRVHFVGVSPTLLVKDIFNLANFFSLANIYEAHVWPFDLNRQYAESLRKRKRPGGALCKMFPNKLRQGCLSSHFWCSEGICILLHHVCDGQRDCTNSLDSSDEMNCTDICHPKPNTKLRRDDETHYQKCQPG